MYGNQRTATCCFQINFIKCITTNTQTHSRAVGKTFIPSIQLPTNRFKMHSRAYTHKYGQHKDTFKRGVKSSGMDLVSELVTSQLSIRNNFTYIPTLGKSQYNGMKRQDTFPSAWTLQFSNRWITNCYTQDSEPFTLQERIWLTVHYVLAIFPFQSSVGNCLV
jgi:hypothetical protein